MQSASPATPYTRHFFSMIDQLALASAEEIVPLVRQVVPFTSVVDVGCGGGAWLHVFQEHGATTIKGFDGDYVNVSELMIPPDCFRAVDLRWPNEISGQFDLAVCLEVAEHLPKKTAEPLIETLCNLAPAVLFSAAIPGQGGTYHINEQWPYYWTALFERRGYRRLDPIRRHVFANPAVASYYKQNVYLFVESSLIEGNERLAEEWRLAKANNVQVIQDHRLIPLMSVQHLTGELFRAIGRAVRNRLSR